MEENLTKTLKEAGYSLTKPRRAVFTVLSSGLPFGMRELALRLTDTIDRASVYRTIALFEQLGIVVRVQQGWKYKVELSDKFAPHHHHITCTNCGRAVSFDEPEGLDELLTAVALRHGFTADGHSLEIIGRCLQCR